jgi:hypothetical protein
LTNTERLLSLRLRDQESDALRIVPVIGSRWSSHRGAVKMIAQAAGRQVVEAEGQAPSESHDYLSSIATLCWLRGADLFISLDSGDRTHSGSQSSTQAPFSQLSIPVTIFLALSDRKRLSSFPQKSLLPVVTVRPLSYKSESMNGTRRSALRETTYALHRGDLTALPL